MAITTYSFLDLAGVMAHPSKGIYTFTGEGVGSITVAMATERTAHDTAADGSIMVSKLAGNSGSVTISAQQTSPLHKWLLDWYNYVIQADTEEWAQASIAMRNTSDGTSHVATGISPGKLPDKAYQAQGQQVSWVLMCADIQSLNA